MTELYFWVRGKLQPEEGQTMAEYAVVLAVITIAVVIALGTLSGKITGALDAIGNTIDGSKTPAAPAGG